MLHIQRLAWLFSGARSLWELITLKLARLCLPNNARREIVTLSDVGVVRLMVLGYQYFATGKNTPWCERLSFIVDVDTIKLALSA